jgi:hypothetical protein
MWGTADKSRIGHPVAEQYRYQVLPKSSGDIRCAFAPHLY